MTTTTQKYIEEWRNQWGSSETYGRPSPQPGVVSWARANHQGKPYFIKVLPKTSSNENARGTSIMFVPGAFVKEHYQELQRDVTLENNDGCMWRITFQSPVAYPVWSTGWRRFARDNDLKTGDHIVFILERDSFFHFTHFDKEGNMTGRHVTTPLINNPDAPAAYNDEFQTSSLGKRRKQSTDNYPDSHTLKKEPASLEIDNTEPTDEHSEGGDVSHSQEESTADSFLSESPSITETRSTYVKVTHDDEHEAGMPRQAPKQVLKMPTAVGATDSFHPGRIPVKLKQVKREAFIVAEDDSDSDHNMPLAHRMSVGKPTPDDSDSDHNMPLALRLSAGKPSPYSQSQRLAWARKLNEQRSKLKKNIRSRFART